jgi:hypothetical protein
MRRRHAQDPTEPPHHAQAPSRATELQIFDPIELRAIGAVVMRAERLVAAAWWPGAREHELAALWRLGRL